MNSGFRYLKYKSLFQQVSSSADKDEAADSLVSESADKKLVKKSSGVSHHIDSLFSTYFFNTTVNLIIDKEQAEEGP